MIFFKNEVTRPIDTIKEDMLQVMLETLPTLGFAVQPAKMFLHFFLNKVTCRPTKLLKLV